MTHEICCRACGDHPIGVFDSGLGGLSAVREIRALLPHESLVYFGDTGRVPYGTRSRETIRHYASQDIRFLLSHADCKAVVVACGTVSANALDDLRAAGTVPIIGVIDPAAEAAVRATQNGRIGVIATPSTIASGAYERALLAAKPDLHVTSQACALFVPLVENGFVDPNDPIPYLTAERYLAPILESGADTLILGCTHYPLLAPVISRVLPGVTLIDTGREAAHSLSALLTEYGLHTDSDTTGSADFYVSDEPQDFARAASRFLGLDADEGVPIVRRVNIEAY
ncbi:MAG: glutamate racemase [Ruminococcaceae bacterium]|nr:glutamate racemase [Oscillospiraceae bacterium]